MKTILVTGCAGFIGSTLCDQLLLSQNRVIGIDNFDAFYDRSVKEGNLKKCMRSDLFTLIEGDICEHETFELIKDKVDMVVHIAAKAGVRPSISDPKSYMNVNVTGTFNLLEWMKSRSIEKMIFASSSSVYGNNKTIPFSENDLVDEPISPYAFSKKSAELLNHTYHHLYNMDIINLRFFTVYGERQRPDLAINKFVKSMLAGKPITLFGDGHTARDYTYIRDIVDGITRAMSYLEREKKVYEILNLGNNNPVSLIHLVDMLYEITGAKRNIEFESSQPGDVDRTFANISKARGLLGYEPKTSLREGLENYVNWMRMRH
jgi:UDP-glucuronate 4-epimerase